jgi:hypothetical protein
MPAPLGGHSKPRIISEVTGTRLLVAKCNPEYKTDGGASFEWRCELSSSIATAFSVQFVSVIYSFTYLLNSQNASYIMSNSKEGNKRIHKDKYRKLQRVSFRQSKDSLSVPASASVR